VDEHREVFAVVQAAIKQFSDGSPEPLDAELQNDLAYAVTDDLVATFVHRRRKLFGRPSFN
jgi:hypothetical protein